MSRIVTYLMAFHKETGVLVEQWPLDVAGSELRDIY